MADLPGPEALPVPGRGPAVLAGLWALLFVVALFGALPELSRYHGDEGFYTDAAVRMERTGDYWTPSYEDGRLRFKKPILTYWAIVAGHRLFGVGLQASRVPFLAAGGLVVLLTFLLARGLAGARVALLASLIMGSNFQLITLATRSTPDVLTCLFLLASMLGFSRVLFRGDRSFAAYLLAYGGMGLAVETKGLLGLAAIGVVLLLFPLVRPPGMRRAELFDFKAVAAGLAIGTCWYLVMLQRHGGVILEDFFSDQVTAKVSPSPVFIFGNFLSYGAAVLAHFLPWTLWVGLAAALQPQQVAELLRRRRREAVFLAGMFLALAVIFSFGNARRPRYLVVAYPLLAVLCALVLEEAVAAARHARWVRRTTGALAALAGALALFCAIAGWRLEPRLTGAALLLAAAAAAAGVLLRRGGSFESWTAAALLVLGVASAVRIFVLPPFQNSPAPELTERLLARGPQAARIYATGSMYWKVPSQIRILSGGRLDALWMEKTDLAVAREPGTIVIVPAKDAAAWTAAGFTLEPAAKEARAADRRTLWRRLVAGDAAAPEHRAWGYFFAEASPARARD
jgi:4-amino-4-deoxy-L-arabinose transferase-like glycosyltransferase